MHHMRTAAMTALLSASLIGFSAPSHSAPQSPAQADECATFSPEILEEVLWDAPKNAASRQAACASANAQERFHVVLDHIRNNYPDAFVDSYFNYEHPEQSEIVVNQDIPAARNTSEFTIRVDGSLAPLDERLERTAKIHDSIRAAASVDSIETHVDPISGKIELTAAPTAGSDANEIVHQIAAALDDAGEMSAATQLQPELTRREAAHSPLQIDGDALQLTIDPRFSGGADVGRPSTLDGSTEQRRGRDGFAGGWNFATCTGAFVIRKGGAYGISTASHCQSSIAKDYDRYDHENQFRVELWNDTNPHHG